MSVLVAIDPGVKNLGWALFEHGQLSVCGLSRSTSPGGHARNLPQCRPGVAVLEYMTSRDLPNAADLIAVATAGAFVVGWLRPEVVLYPRASDWKGSVPKVIHHERLKAKLSPAELAVVEAAIAPPHLLHNVWDAVGLGLWGVRR
jgi:hypothetical protein